MDSTGRSPADEYQTDETHSGRSGDGILFWILVACALALSSVSASVYLSERGVSEELAQSVETLRKLKGKQADLEAKKKQFREQREQERRDKDVVGELLALCRSAEDIPSFQSDQVIVGRHYRRMRLYVPAGKHRLEISTINVDQKHTFLRWYSHNYDGESEQTWSISVPGNSRYMLELIGDNALEGWKLTGSDPAFEPRQEAVSSTFDGVMSSTGVSVFYPNQRPSDARGLSLQDAASHPPPLRLFRTGDFKVNGDTQKEFFIAVKLYSEGPATIQATDAIGVIDSD